jgi:RNA polymerase sigma factor (sigma-70 family)
MECDAGANLGTRRKTTALAGYPPEVPVEMLNSDQERLLLEHLPIVRFLARRIHERLPQHVDIEDLVSAGVVGLMDAFAKFDPRKKVQFRSYAQFRIRGAAATRSSAFAAPSLTACVRSTGALAICDAKEELPKKRSAFSRRGLDALLAKLKLRRR